MAAVSGLIVLVCHCWLPLAVFVAPAGVLVLVPHLGAGWSRRRSVAALLLLAAGAAGSLKAALMLFATVSLGSLVGQDGGYNAPALIPLLILLLSGCYALLTLGQAQARRGGEALLPRWQRLLLLWTPVAGLVMLCTLFVVQVQRQGETTYYFVKLLLGYELVLAVLVPAVVAVLVVTLLAPGGRRLPRVATSVLLSLVATVSFGVVTPAQAKLFDTSDGGTASLVPPYSRTGLAEGILAAVGESTGRQLHDGVRGAGTRKCRAPVLPRRLVPCGACLGDHAGDGADGADALGGVDTRGGGAGHEHDARGRA